MGVRETVGFTERRLARLGGADLFATAYSDPIPSPDGDLLGWISDRDGRPQVFVAALPPDGEPITEPEFPLMSADAGDVQAISWSPDGAWIACQLAPFGGERTSVRLVTPDGGRDPRHRPRRGRGHPRRLVPRRAAAGRDRVPGGRRRRPGLPGRPARRHLDGAGRRPGRPGLRGQRRRAAGGGPARPPRRPPAGAGRPVDRAAHRAAARRRRERGRRPVRRHRPAALRAHRRRPRPARAARRHAARQRLGDQRATRSPSGPTTTSTWSRWTRAGCAPRWSGTWPGAARWSCSTCAPGWWSRCRPAPARWSPGPRSPGTPGRCWSPAEGPTVPPRLSRIPLDDPDGGPAEPTPLLAAEPAEVDDAGQPDPAHVPGRGRAAAVRVAVPAARRAGSAAHPALAARRPGGAGAAGVPAAVPGAGRRGRRGVRAERARLRRLRAHLRRRRRPGPPVRRDHRRAGRGRLPGRPRSWPTRPGSGCPAAPTAAT